MSKSKFTIFMITAAILSTIILWGCSVSSENVFNKYTNNESKFLDIGGTKIHYRDEGRGPVLLCLHGILSSLHTWDGWVDCLKDRYRIIRLDLPGWALSSRSTFGYTTEGYINFLVEFLDKLNIQKVSIAGNSFGGFLTWNFVLSHPDRVRSMILIDAGGYPFKAPLQVTLLTMPVISFFSSIITPKFIIASSVKDVFGSPDKVTDETIDRYYSLLLYKDNRKETVAILKEIEKTIHNKTTAIKSIKHPTLILWGGSDDWIPLHVMERFKQDIPHAKTIIYDGVGHIPMEEIPKQSAKDADLFLSGM